jgi:hypothetical protein
MRYERSCGATGGRRKRGGSGWREGGGGRNEVTGSGYLLKGRDGRARRKGREDKGRIEGIRIWSKRGGKWVVNGGETRSK